MENLSNQLNESLNEAKGINPEDLEVGKTYITGYRKYKDTGSKFLGWKIEKAASWNKTESPVMHFDENGFEWTAFMDNGVMSVGSSSDKLIIYEEVKSK